MQSATPPEKDTTGTARGSHRVPWVRKASILSRPGRRPAACSRASTMVRITGAKDSGVGLSPTAGIRYGAAGASPRPACSRCSAARVITGDT